MAGQGDWEMRKGVWARGKTTAPIEVSSHALKNMFRIV